MVRSYPGVVRKAPLKDLVARLGGAWRDGPQLENFGDDAAVIPWGEGYLLIAADGIMKGLILNEPYAAGKASVMVTVNDIYAMGGRPIALVNVLASGDPVQRDLILDGIKRGCEKLGVPMVGGHLHPDADPEWPSLSVAIVGWANSLLRSHLAVPGDRIIFAADLQGKRGCGTVTSWDANSGKTTQEIKFRLEALPAIAEEGLCKAAKDVSNAGLLGTAAIMMENSGTGAEIDIPSIRCPSGISLEEWVLCFQSFGFLLSVPPGNERRVMEIFSQRSIDTAVIGEVTNSRQVILKKGQDRKVLFDLERETITGISAKPLSPRGC
jgi:selenophosphate synthetase-related protein